MMKNQKRKIIYGIVIATVVLGLFVRHYIHEERELQREIEDEQFRIERSLEFLDHNLGRVVIVDPLYSTWDINNRQDNSTSIIRLASIYYTLGIDADEVEEIWLDRHHELHRELRSHLTNVGNSNGDHAEFEEILIGIVRNNQELLEEMGVPSEYFEWQNFPLDGLTFEAIQFVLEQKGLNFE